MHRSPADLSLQLLRRTAPLAGIVACLGAPSLLAGCSDERPAADVPISFRDDVAPLFGKCEPCHAGASPAAGFRTGRYVDAIACLASSGAPATGAYARVLADDVHKPLLTESERAVVTRWVTAGAPGLRSGVHDAHFADPRSPASHGPVLRAQRWAPMLDPQHPDACGRCHAGAPARPEKITAAAPGATACTTCHTEPEGPLGCSTCHGVAGRPYPPRNACFFPDEAAKPGAHKAHVLPSPARGQGLECASCHPTPSQDPKLQMTGSHGDGRVDVVLAPAVAFAGATYDAASHQCTTGCHAREGAARPVMTWTDTTKVKCGDCHGNPPPQHYQGQCEGCHQVSGDPSRAPGSTATHMNARIDFGDGSGRCGSCHGKGDDPAPSTNAHPAHLSARGAADVQCVACHVVPTAFGKGKGHPRGDGPRVTFSGLASSHSASPSYSGGSCAGVYCHGATMGSSGKPSWTDRSGAPAACGTCHAIPPPPPHVQTSGCESPICHGSEVSAGTTTPTISPARRSFHVNGAVDLRVP